MLKKISRRRLLIACLLSIVLPIVCCNPARNKIDVSQVNVNIVADRLENDLVNHSNDILWLKNKYGKFFELFISQIIHLGISDTTDSALVKKQLNNFIADPDIKNIYADSKKAYDNFDDINRQFTDAFRHYKYYFPSKLIPRVITFISGFNYAIVSTDSALGIGLDMYLGSDSRFYPALELPQYKIRKMNKNHLVADVMRGWAQTEWEENASSNDLLSQMIYEGKMLYFLDMMMPDTPDSIKMGYTQNQIDWCRENEKNTWAFFVDHNLLFVTDASQTAKYTNEGLTTGGFPKESPGNIGQWIGYAIVQSYMKQFPEITLEKLMLEQDYKKIFRDSKYKPRK